MGGAVRPFPLLRWIMCLLKSQAEKATGKPCYHFSWFLIVKMLVRICCDSRRDISCLIDWPLIISTFWLLSQKEVLDISVKSFRFVINWRRNRSFFTFQLLLQAHHKLPQAIIALAWSTLPWWVLLWFADKLKPCMISKMTAKMLQSSQG